MFTSDEDIENWSIYWFRNISLTKIIDELRTDWEKSEKELEVRILQYFLINVPRVFILFNLLYIYFLLLGFFFPVQGNIFNFKSACMLTKKKSYRKARTQKHFSSKKYILEKSLVNHMPIFCFQKSFQKHMLNFMKGFCFWKIACVVTN